MRFRDVQVSSEVMFISLNTQTLSHINNNTEGQQEGSAARDVNLSPRVHMMEGENGL